MQWEALTADDFGEAVKTTGVCCLPLGVLERHGPHLPLGTDYLNVHKLCCQAAEKEPAVVFPPFYFGQIYEARCFPGAFTLKPRLLLELLQAVLDEIGRNGFKKIILVNGHGGNAHLLSFLTQCSLWEEKPYSVYMPKERVSKERAEQWREILDTSLHAHACECESSITLANQPEMVRMDALGEDEVAEPLGRLDHLPPTQSGISWYANYPEHYAGDARPATQAKGNKLVSLMVDTLAEYIAAVKADKVMPKLEREFFARERELRENN